MPQVRAADGAGAVVRMDAGRAPHHRRDMPKLPSRGTAGNQEAKLVTPLSAACGEGLFALRAPQNPEVRRVTCASLARPKWLRFAAVRCGSCGKHAGQSDMERLVRFAASSSPYRLSNKTAGKWVICVPNRPIQHRTGGRRRLPLRPPRTSQPVDGRSVGPSHPRPRDPSSAL